MPTKATPIQIYVAVMATAAGGCLLVQDWSSIPDGAFVGLGSLILLGLFAEASAISVTVARSTGHSSITFIPFLTAVLLYGPPAGVLLAFVTQTVSELGFHRKPITKAVFNIAQWIVISSLSGWLFLSVAAGFGADPSAFLADNPAWNLVPAFVVLAVSMLFLNHFFVATAIALAGDKRLARVFQLLSGSAGANFVFGVLISPVALVVAILYVHLGVLGLFLSILPLVFIRRSYANNIRLKKANRDLLKALVKAIETRDPYTSGHSMRVSILAKRIAEGLRLSPHKVEDIETAALLHDIGKIEPMYIDILRKPDSLTPQERSIIESHVTKGVELLESISSFPTSVIAAVEHHHEREDGKGYPDGLRGEDIPLGAKIIKVCDAVDAMLSDRPYRDALTVDQVKEQLITYAGSQFDVAVVSCVLKEALLPAHRAAVVESLNQPTLDLLEEESQGVPRRPDPRVRDSLTAMLSVFQGSKHYPDSRTTSEL